MIFLKDLTGSLKELQKLLRMISSSSRHQNFARVFSKIYHYQPATHGLKNPTFFTYFLIILRRLPNPRRIFKKHSKQTDSNLLKRFKWLIAIWFDRVYPLWLSQLVSELSLCLWPRKDPTSQNEWWLILRLRDKYVLINKIRCFSQIYFIPPFFFEVQYP